MKKTAPAKAVITDNTEEDDRIQWHQGFCAGLELDLRQWKQYLTFEREHQLTKQSIVADLLIIRKEPGVAIGNPVAQMFRTYNLVEYKSPVDYLSMDGFCKAVSYAYLYKSLGEREDAIPLEEVTLSLFCAHRPRKLFAKLKAWGAEITEREAGIYPVSGLLGLAVQVVVEDQLPPGTHAALRLLLKPPTAADYAEINHMRETLQDQEDWNNFMAVMQVSVAGNTEVYQQLKEESGMNVEAAARIAFADLFEKERAEGCAEGRAEGREKGRAEGREEMRSLTILNMLRDHLPLDMIRKYTNLSTENIMEIARSAGLTPAT